MDNSVVVVDAASQTRFRSAGRLLVQRWWVVVCTALLFGGASLVLTALQDPVYRSTATLYVTVGSTSEAPNAYQDSLASQQRVLSYGQLATSDLVVGDALRSSGLELSIDEAKTSLRASSTPDTVLLNLSAESKSAVVSDTLVNAVADSLSANVSSLEVPSSGGEPLAKVTVVSPAGGGSEIVSPRPVRDCLLGVFVGVLLGVLVVFALYRLDRTVRTVDGLEEAIDAPVLGTVPRDPLLGEPGFVDFGAGASLVAESYRRVRTNLGFADLGSSTRRILVSSASLGEGKTTTAINVAASLAEDGHRVILVDCDLRRPTVSRRLSLNKSVGLTDYILGRGDLADLVQSGGIDNLDVLTTGALPPNPVELLGSDRCRELFDELAATYDYIIVDSPPILPVSDGAVLSQWVESVLFVVRIDLTKRPDLSTAISHWTSTNARLLGLVVNDASESSGAYSYTYSVSSEDDVRSSVK